MAFILHSETLYNSRQLSPTIANSRQVSFAPSAVRPVALPDAYPKTSGAFTGFDYKIVHLRSETDASKGHVYSASMEFTAVGYSKKEEFQGDMYITPDPEVYENGDQFVADMVAGIIPELI